MIKALNIKAIPRRGFWRCGVYHPPEWTKHPGDRFTPEELERLQAEPKLQVKVVEAEEPVRTEPAVEAAAPAAEEKPAEPEPAAGDGQEGPNLDELIWAARKCVPLGYVTKDGKPTVEGMGKILKRNVNAADRDRAWSAIEAKAQGD